MSIGESKSDRKEELEEDGKKGREGGFREIENFVDVCRGRKGQMDFK